MIHCFMSQALIKVNFENKKLVSHNLIPYSQSPSSYISGPIQLSVACSTPYYVVLANLL